MRKEEKAVNDFCDRHPVVGFLKDVLMVFLDRRVTRSAAELAYYLLMTIFPIIIMVLFLASRLPLDAEEVAAFMEGIFPQPVAELMEEYIAYVLNAQGLGMFYAALLTTLTAASAAFRGLVSISGEIYGRRAFRGVRYWGISFLFSILLVVVIYMSIAVLLTGGWVMRWVREVLPLNWLTQYWSFLRLLILFALAMVFLMLLYQITSPGGTVHPPVMLGAFVTAVLLTVMSSVFSALIGASSRYSVVYGSLASVIILMFWLYLVGNLLILGNVFNYVWWRRRRGLTVALYLERRL